MSLTAFTPDFNPSLPLEVLVGVEGIELLPFPLDILERVDRANERRELVSESRFVGLVVVLDEFDVDGTEEGRSRERDDSVGEEPFTNDTDDEDADAGERSSGVRESMLVFVFSSSFF